MRLVHAGALSLTDVDRGAVVEARAGVESALRHAATGRPADVVVLDPDQAWVVDPERFMSRGHNTPLAGQTLRGTVLLTIANGDIVYRNGV